MDQKLSDFSYSKIIDIVRTFLKVNNVITIPQILINVIGQVNHSV